MTVHRIKLLYYVALPSVSRSHPLRKANAKQIAKELFLFSSRVRIPKEILTDQETSFMSRVTRELCDLL